SPDGRFVAAGANNEVQLWDLATRQEIVKWPAAGSGAIDDLAFDPINKVLATAHAYLNCIRLWNLETLQGMEPVLHTTNMANGIAFSPDGKWLAAAAGRRYGEGIPGEVKIWDTATWQVRTTLSGVRDWLTRVKFSPDGRWVAAGGGGGFV